MSGEGFDDLTDVYEAMIDWPQRLANESPFYRRWFERTGVRSVVDVACGTGRHAALFHSWNLRVEGADLSPRMIETRPRQFRRAARPALGGARLRSAHPRRRALRRGDVRGQFPGPGARRGHGPAGDRRDARRGAAGRRSIDPPAQSVAPARRPGGVAEVPARPTLPQGEVLILKGVHRSGGKGYVELIVASLSGDATMRTESVPLLGLESADLERMARRSGAAEVSFFGGYQEQPYDRVESVDLLMVARK